MSFILLHVEMVLFWICYVKNRARKLKITYMNHIILLLDSAALQSGF